MANGFQTQRSFFYFALVSTMALSLSTAEEPLSSEEDIPAKRVGIILEGTFEKHDIFELPQDAVATQLVPFYEWDYGVKAFDEKYWTENRFTWERIKTIALNVADKLVDVVEPDFVRDERGVIKYAFIKDKDPFLTSIILSTRLLERFSESLGDRLHVVCVDRHLMYFFPADGYPIEEFGSALVSEYREARLPVSLEVILVDKDGIRVVGELLRSP